MVIEQYPHTATLHWVSEGTTNTVGVWTPGTLNTIGIVCDIQPASGQYVLGEGGAVLNYDWHVFSLPFDGASTVPKDAKLEFFNADHIMVQLFPYQKHVEIKCQG